ncbi:hypothetical protein IRY61_04990 [Candidatus Saccharibacteria bacterium]|nr:hypothetical protein [Candidatus Saccharibacteria bacterium]
MTESEKTAEQDFNKAYGLLALGKESAAAKIFRKYLPCMGHIDFHYALYSIEEAAHFEDEYLNPAKLRHGTSFARIIKSEIDRAHKQNPGEAYKLLEWSKTNEVGTHEKVRNSNSGMDLIHAVATQGLDHDKRSVYKQAVDAYKDKFEVEVFLVFLANLLLIQKGNDFSDTPFKKYRLLVNGERVHKGRNLSKGLAVSWLTENAQGAFGRLIEACYITSLRNLSGHHAYTINTRYRRIEANGQNISLRKIFLHLRLLSRMHLSISLEASLALFEHEPFLGPYLNDLGIQDWGYDYKNKTLVISQFFGNFDPKRKHKTVGFYTPPVRGKENIVSINFDHNTVYPYDSRVIASKGTLDMLIRIQAESKVKTVLLGVAPEISPFTKLKNFPRTNVMGTPMIIVNSIETELVVDQASAKKVAETLSQLKPGRL